MAIIEIDENEVGTYMAALYAGMRALEAQSFANDDRLAFDNAQFLRELADKL